MATRHASHSQRIPSSPESSSLPNACNARFRAGVPAAALERIARVDGYGSLGLERRQALWQVKALGAAPLPLFVAADRREGRLRPELEEPPVALARIALGRRVVEDYRSIGLTLGPHPAGFVRGDLERLGAVPARTLRTMRGGERVTVAGLVLVRQRPGSAKGVMFITLEDETDAANLVVWPSLFERQRRVVLSAGMMACRGRVQREGEVVHVVAHRLIDLSHLMRTIGDRGGPLAPSAGPTAGRCSWRGHASPWRTSSTAGRRAASW